MVKALYSLNGNNRNSKINEGAKQCDGISQKNGKRPRDPCDIDDCSFLQEKMRDALKGTLDEYVDNELVRHDVNEKIEAVCKEAIDALEKKKREARKSAPDSNKDLPPTETKTVGGWEVVGTFDKEKRAKLKAEEYFAKQTSRCLKGKTVPGKGKRWIYTYLCAEHCKEKCPMRARIRWNNSTKWKYVVDVTDSSTCIATFFKKGQ